jgi:hypothetical protein
MLSDFGRRYLPPNCPGFTYTARATAVGEEFGDMMEEEERKKGPIRAGGGGRVPGRPTPCRSAGAPD